MAWRLSCKTTHTRKPKRPPDSKLNRRSRDRTGRLSGLKPAPSHFLPALAAIGGSPHVVHSLARVIRGFSPSGMQATGETDLVRIPPSSGTALLV
jgi:hypothetical protein